MNPIEIAAGIGLQIEDLQQAIGHVIQQHQTSQQAKLRGQDGLQITNHGSDLYIKLNAVSSTGRCYSAESWVILTEDEDGPVRVGLDWKLEPLCENSAVRVGVPSLRRLGTAENGQDGEFLLGQSKQGQLIPCPVPAERLDSCPANASWATSAQELLRQIDNGLACLVRNLQQNRAPVLEWCWLLQPTLMSVSQARLTSAEESVEELMTRINSVIKSLKELNERATILHAPAILNLLHILPKPSMDHSAVAFHERTETCLNLLANAEGWLTELLGANGHNLNELPSILYQDGRLFRLATTVGSHLESSADRRRSTFTVPNDSRFSLALLWQSTTIQLGDVRLLPTGDSRLFRPEDIYLGALANRQNLHWVADLPAGTWVIDAPTDLHLLDAGLFESIID